MKTRTGKSTSYSERISYIVLRTGTYSVLGAEYSVHKVYTPVRLPADW